MGDLKTTTASPAGALNGTDRLIGAQGSSDVYFPLSGLASYITALITASAPATLDTLYELAAALGNDPNFAATLTTALAGKQPLDSDLTDIAALAPSNDYVLQRKAGAWTARSMAQLRADLAVGRDPQIIVPTNGGTSNLTTSTAGEILVYLNHASTIASHTINLPALADGQRISFRAKAAITAATLVAASGTILGTIASFTANGHASWEWVAATSELWRAE